MEIAAGERHGLPLVSACCETSESGCGQKMSDLSDTEVSVFVNYELR
jgi:hypothetical protein